MVREPVKVFVNGYGNIGRRLAFALSKDRDISLVGIAKYTVDEEILKDLGNKFDIYVPENLVNTHKSRVSGSIKGAVSNCDLVIDAAKEGGGYDNKIKVYEPLGKPAIFQGGEKRHGDRAVANMIHNSRVNYDEASGEQYIIQGSCNVSGMGKIMQPLMESFGDQILRFDVTLVRRWADLEDSKEVKDSIQWAKSPHHQEDVKDFIPKANLYVEAFKVPSRMMHLHQMVVRFNSKSPTRDQILDLFSKEFAVATLNSAKGTADVRMKAIELGFEHGDTNMVHIHSDVLRVQDETLKIVYSDDQTGLVIPENHLLLQSMIMQRPRPEAVKKTDELFRISEKKVILEKEFS
ncbi:MAG TPA: type II glyceraldehyde-3-phosphate dehydrogenase [Nitrososphaeraceae archaeon]|jgi:glyceraldehyde-3-phosphate dehydrogenase (NAD(P))|nr:type II glyceraldehyde-3-phosphate dehydrogenase [Nitrososphaeraceae archaeon]